jgi:RNA polymerase sigma-70 factor (ECF subfamily)
LSFETTQWSVVLAAGGEDSRAARTALAALCEAYWYPLYAYVRRWGATADDACDLTQAFLTSLLERRDFKGLSQERGRFRAFLLASLRHFLANDAAKRRSQKRGGGAATVPLQSEDAEHRYLVEPVDSATPERLYERRWALTIIDRVLVELRREAETEGRTAEFEAIKACMLGRAAAGSYAAIAARLGVSEGAVRVAVHRLRRRFQARLKQDIAATVSSPDQVDDEIRYLIKALDQ